MNNHYLVKFICFWLLLLLATFHGLAQNQSITGTITDMNGNAIQNAVISIIENPGMVVNSDQDGKFIISGQIGHHVKVTDSEFYIKTIKITDNSMAITIDSNDEYIPLGYGLQLPEEELTMAIGIVKSDELSKSSAILSANALYGKIAGLTVLQNGGIPGYDDPTLLMRAPGTTRDNSMLILADGFERPISFYTLSEIESVVLLKDAGSLSLYGLRGANGVLLVTTKMNKMPIGKPQINIGYESGITRAFRKPVFLDGYGYANAYNEALANDGLPAQYSQGDLDLYRSGTDPYFHPNVNWLEETFKDFGRTNNLNLTFGGSSKSLRYFTLLDYQNDDGLLRPVDLNKGYSTQFRFSRLNLRTNLNINVTATTKLMVRIGGSLIDDNRPAQSASNIMNAIYSIPSSAFPVKTFINDWGGTSSYSNNPVATIAARGYSIFRTRGVMADIRLEQKLDLLLKGLSLEAAYSNDNIVNVTDSKTQTFAYRQISLVKDPITGIVTDTTITTYGTKTNLSFGTSISSVRKGATLLGRLNYKKEWGSNSINSVLLYQQEQLILITRFNTYLRQLIAGNIHFSNSGKYFADLSMSYTGTNLIPEDYRFGFFPALSAAWNLSKEDWFKGGAAINNLKIMASWGMAGSDLVPQNMEVPYNSGASGYLFTANNNSAGGWSEGSLTPGNLSFEKSYKSSFGLDANIFRKLDLNLNAYYEIRKNILITSIGTIASTVGNTMAYQMGGIVDNKGIDVDLRFHDTRDNFTYYFIGLFSYSKSKIVEMFEQFRPNDNLKRTGKSVGQAFGLEAIGLFRDLAEVAASPAQKFGTAGPGDVKYKDQNGDKIINEFDEIPLGYSTLYPEIYYSGSVGLKYKGIGFEALLQGIGNHSVYANTRNVFWPIYGNTNISTFSDNRWTTGTSETAALPKISTRQSLNNYRPNSIWTMDGSYLKLRSLELYYDFPKGLSWFKSGNVRIYLRWMNLFSLDYIKVVDPEEIGIVYPTLTSFHIGIKLGL